ncbi:hypothetical protein Q4534_06955 [Cyclobacterium sp. 1_MG-2023]|uniref:hypothetical protein n=1 Tax=Cyclobacterium sp. 1_MG-2023 TaxID=3062681 RepID=UPI0026E19236|nr:hypothetical protein [Cyclobacterium sp. 1_MG-2023]MDO6437135.1 hypothetical protein [Cyclobacterium sp. 1_MG-2023]
MKVKDYLPLYGLLFNFEYFTMVDGKEMTVYELFENYPELEITDTHLSQFYYFDLGSLQLVLKDDSFTEKSVVSYLRDLFDQYRQSGGDPNLWLKETLYWVNFSPDHYRKDLIGIIEKTLLDWTENFDRLPIDYCYEYANDILEVESSFNILESIWLNNPKMTKEDFLRKGLDLGLWDKNYELIAKRGSIYGSGKRLLANLYISLKGNSINDNIDHKKVGLAFCEFFNIRNNPNTANQFKQFQRGEGKEIKLIKKDFKLNS